MISELKDVFGSLTKALDVLYVMEGNKPVSRIMLNEDDKDVFKFLNERGLYHLTSDFKVIKHIDKTRAYSDKGIIVDIKDFRKGSYFLYVSKDREKAEEAKNAEREKDHHELGKLLGYPKCCCDFFSENSEGAEKGTNDLTLSSFRKSKGIEFPWQNNNCLRGFDISLISHFPCSFGCKESMKIAEKNLEIIEKHDKDAANYFRRALKSAVIYSEGVGVYSLDKFSVVNNRINYDKNFIASTNKNDFYNILRRRDRITPFSKNDFLVGEVRIKDAQTFLALFS